MANFQQGPVQQTKPVRRGPPKASRAAAAVFSRLAKSTRYADPGLVENWPSIVGAEIAAFGRPGKLHGNGPGRTLEVIVRDGAAGTEMQMRADDLILAVNRFLGPDAVNRIAVRQRPGGGLKPGDGRDGGVDRVNTPSDGPLGAALSSFRAAIRAKSSDK